MENKAQTKKDVELIHELVEEYISNERTIILAVISAKHDYAIQSILSKARAVDPDGKRTLGIITKPDTLRPDSENEQDWLDLAQNKNIYFKLGWHMLKNRADGELKTTFEERNAAEANFFSKGNYSDLDKNCKGIETLRIRLSKTLSDHLKQELPSLKQELVTKLDLSTKDLEALGDSRATIAEQKQYLTGVGMATYNLFKSAVHGHYEQAFFGDVDTDENIDAGSNIKRLRAVIQFLNSKFAERMRLQGRKYIILDNNGVDTAGDDPDGGTRKDPSEPSEILTESDEERMADHVPKTISRREGVDWVIRVLKRSRGRELPGNFNPMLISQLFWEQSSPWEVVALAHIDTVAMTCQDFVKLVMREVATREVETRLHSVRIESALKTALSNARAELKKIIADKSGHPITYNHYYTTTIQKMRHNKHDKLIQKLAERSETNGYDSTGEPATLIDPIEFKSLVDNRIELNMDRFSAEEALDNTLAYYKQELKYFIDVVTKQVIERHLISALPDTILSPLIIASMSDEEIELVAAEPAEVSEKRKFLEGRKKMLEDGQDTFRRAMSGLRRKT